MANTLQRLRSLLGLDRRSETSPRRKNTAAARIQAARKQKGAALVMKACPFCGLRPAEVCDDPWNADLGYYCQIVCLACGAAGPQCTTEDAAWKGWNERTMPREH